MGYFDFKKKMESYSGLKYYWAWSIWWSICFQRSYLLFLKWISNVLFWKLVVEKKIQFSIWKSYFSKLNVSYYRIQDIAKYAIFHFQYSQFFKLQITIFTIQYSTLLSQACSLCIKNNF